MVLRARAPRTMMPQDSSAIKSSCAIRNQHLKGRYMALAPYCVGATSPSSCANGREAERDPAPRLLQFESTMQDTDQPNNTRAREQRKVYAAKPLSHTSSVLLNHPGQPGHNQSNKLRLINDNF